MIVSELVRALKAEGGLIQSGSLSQEQMWTQQQEERRRLDFFFFGDLRSALLDPKPSLHAHVAHVIWRKQRSCHGESLTAGRRGKHTLTRMNHSRALQPECLNEFKHKPTVVFPTADWAKQYDCWMSWNDLKPSSNSVTWDTSIKPVFSENYEHV